MSNNTPFFILGSVLSGTTLLRNLLRVHPRLVCPEETHVFRWGEPFGTTDFAHVYNVSDTLILHRKMDGISEDEFKELYSKSKDKGSLITHYFEKFKQVNQHGNKRCFDKTPQNVYGVPLIKSYFPEAKFIQIIRNPLNVVTSLKLGHSLNPQPIIGAINYWKEAMLIMDSLKPLWGSDIYQFKYEDLTTNPEIEINNLLGFLGEEKIALNRDEHQIRQSEDTYLRELTDDEVQLVKTELAQYMKDYNYL